MTADNGWQGACVDGYLKGAVGMVRDVQKVGTRIHAIAKTFLDKLEHLF
ncbi:MAG TPA: hypothetical protein VKF36_07315 [Syntrophorhabdales bacterium]|nr:hypothetical protein [Syntrophorhabdales bacterium]